MAGTLVSWLVQVRMLLNTMLLLMRTMVSWLV